MQDVGRILKEKRIAQGLEIGDLARKSRIRDSYLKAMEENRLQAIPIGYYKGYLRIYADFLGLDAAVLFALHDQKQRGPAPQQPASQPDAPSAGLQPTAVSRLEPTV